MKSVTSRPQSKVRHRAKTASETKSRRGTCLAYSAREHWSFASPDEPIKSARSSRAAVPGLHLPRTARPSAKRGRSVAATPTVEMIQLSNDLHGLDAFISIDQRTNRVYELVEQQLVPSDEARVALLHELRSCLFCSENGQAWAHLGASLQDKVAQQAVDLEEMRVFMVSQLRDNQKSQDETRVEQARSRRGQFELRAEQRRAQRLAQGVKMLEGQIRAHRDENEALHLQVKESATARQILEHEKREEESARVREHLDAERETANLRDELDTERTAKERLEHELRTVRQEQQKQSAEVEMLRASLERVSEALAQRGLDLGPEHAEVKPLQGLGYGSNVPVFLRYDGWLVRRHVPKAKLEQLLQRIWALKLADDNASRRHGKCLKTLPVFFEKWTRERFPDTQKRMQYVYNLVEALRKCSYDPDCDLFLRVLFGQLSQDVFVEQMKLVTLLKRLLSGLEGGQGLGLITLEVFGRLLQRFFPSKTEERRDALLETCREEHLTRDSVDVRKLLHENEDGDQSAFVEQVRSQFVEELVEFSQGLEQALVALVPRAERSRPRLMVAQIRGVLKDYCKQYTDQELNQVLRRGLRTDVFLPKDWVEIQDFMRALGSKGVFAPKNQFVGVRENDLIVQETLNSMQEHGEDVAPQAEDDSSGSIARHLELIDYTEIGGF